MDLIPAILLYALLPIWIALGFLDWLCHRRSQIALHCGPWESVVHLLLLAQAGIALLLGLLLELNETVLAILGLCFITHEITAYVDIRYAHAHRDLSPAEQRVHDFMTAIPTSAMCLLLVRHWDAVRMLAMDPARILGAGFHWKAEPLPLPLVLAVVAAVLIVDGLPYLEELLRGIKAQRIVK